MPVELESVKGMRKAAVLCVLLGEDVSSTLFRSLWEDEIEALSKEISQLSNIPSELTDAVLDAMDAMREGNGTVPRRPVGRRGTGRVG